MATTLSVVTFATGPHKLQLLQPAHGKNNNNSETEIQRMDIKRKQPAIMVSPDSTATVVITNGSYSHGTTVTTPNTTTAASLKLRRRTTPTPSGFTGQQPVSVARRNARERNRVKQVNNGFATLRQHIPYTSRNKKMSKVETLRCAVEYIRSLKQLLDENDTNVSSSGEESDNAILQQAGVVFQHDTVSDSASEPQFVPDEFKDGFDEPMLPATSRSYLTMQDRLPSLVTAFSAQELTLVGTSNSLSPTYSDTSSNNSSCPPEAPGYLAVFGSKSGAVDLQPLRHQSVKNEVTKDDDGVLDVMTWWDPRSSLRQVTTS